MGHVPVVRERLDQGGEPGGFDHGRLQGQAAGLGVPRLIRGGLHRDNARGPEQRPLPVHDCWVLANQGFGEAYGLTGRGTGGVRVVLGQTDPGQQDVDLGGLLAVVDHVGLGRHQRLDLRGRLRQLPHGAGGLVLGHQDRRDLQPVHRVRPGRRRVGGMSGQHGVIERAFGQAMGHGGVEPSPGKLRIGDPGMQLGQLPVPVTILRRRQRPGLHDLQRARECGRGLVGVVASQEHHAQIVVGVSRLGAPGVAGRIERHQTIGELLVGLELGLRLLELAAPLGDIAQPVDALGMVEDALRIVGLAGQQFGGALGRLLEEGQSGVHVAALLAQIAHQVQDPRAAAQRAGVQLGAVLGGVIGHGALGDVVEQVEAPGRLQLAAQVGQHELDQPLGLGPLGLGLVARGESHRRQPAHQHHAGQRGGGDRDQLPVPALGVATDQFVKAAAQHARQQLQKRHPPPVALRPQVRRGRLGGRGPDLAVAAQVETQRAREALQGLVASLLGRKGLAGDDHRQDTALAMQSLEADDFALHPG